MANSLLDFVMSLVRDPDAAARYAADPAQAIADAQLTDVTSVDVNNLIPVVSESLSMAAPSATFDGLGIEPAGNVWASGAATAAFDAFDDPASAPAVLDTSPVITDTLDGVGVPAGAESDADWAAEFASPQLDAPVIDDAAAAGAEFGDDWAQPVTDDQPVEHPGAFDLFD
ncbi:Rv0340 family protein [Mycolicibacterium sp. S2-37]|uniref:Rv0340 family IniB-related protein n=1 Tax=Mycolicibacterium sp. S2-37 TaxID=2810297 RepID=UPI001A949743|nr:Rv0340 family IniB-related protein [Mycolicibacterium sp. S2-37]MBO0681316.1 Rv0340 family protein [Mycolicibacterium sp. S2-37]